MQELMEETQTKKICTINKKSKHKLDNCKKILRQKEFKDAVFII